MNHIVPDCPSPITALAAARRTGLLHTGFLSRALLFRAMLALAVSSSLGTSAQAQISGTWSGGGGLNGNWTDSNNWAGNITPSNGSTTFINLGATTGTTTLNQDFGAPFLLNRLTFTTDQPTSGDLPASFTLTGGALQFIGSGPQIVIRGNGATETINNQLIISSSGGLAITAQTTPGNGTFIINGNITSSQAGGVLLSIGGGATTTSTINGAISDGSGIVSLSKINSGSTYALTNTGNSFSGYVTVTGGALIVASLANKTVNSALGSGDAIVLGGNTSSGTVILNSTGSTPFNSNRDFILAGTTGAAIISNDSPNSAASLTLTGGTVTANVAGLKAFTLGGSNNGANALNSVVSDGAGTVAIVKTGSGTWSLGSTLNSYSGGTTINGGTLQAGSAFGNTLPAALSTGGVTLTASSGNVAILGANGTLTTSLGNLAGQILFGSSGGFAAVGGNLTLSLNAGAGLVWTSGSFVPASRELQFASEAGRTVTLQNNLDLGNAVRTINVVSGTADLTGIVSGTTSSGIFKSGEGTLNLANSYSFAGNSTISAGTVNVSGVVSGTGATSTINFGSAGPAFLNVSGTMTLFNIVGSETSTGMSIFRQTSGLVTLSNSATNSHAVARMGYGYFDQTGGTFQSALTSTATAGRFIITNGLSGAPVTGVARVSGSGSVIGGIYVLVAFGGQTLPANAFGTLSVETGGKVAVNSGAANAGLGVTWTGSGHYGNVNLAGGTITTTSRPIVLSFGSGNNRTAIVNVAAGVISSAGFSTSTVAGTGNRAFINFSGGTFKPSQTTSSFLFTEVSGTGIFAIKTTLFGPIQNLGTEHDFVGGATFDTPAGYTHTVDNQLLGATGFGVSQANISASGDLSGLAGNSNYVGAPGLKFLGGGANSVPAAGYALISGGKVTEIVITNPGVYTDTDAVTLEFSGGGGSIGTLAFSSLTTANVAGGLTKTGAGTLVLGAANSYNGTTINAGIISITGTGTLGTTSGALSLNGGQLNLGATSQTVGAVSISSPYSGDDAVKNGTLTASSYNVSNTSGNVGISAALAGLGGLTKSGAGTLELKANNSYSGATLVSGGTLQVTGTLGNTAVSIVSGATLLGSGTLGGTISNSGTLSGGLTIAGAVTNQIGGAITPGTLGTVGTMTLGSLILSGGSLNFDLGTIGLGNSDRLILSGGSFNVTAATSFNFNDLGTFGLGTYDLISGYTGAIGGFNLLSAPSLFSNYSLTLADNSGVLQLLVTASSGTGGSQDLTWAGGSGTWGSSNYQGNATYTNGDAVTFNDSPGTSTVSIAGSVAPGAVTVNNNLGNTYVFSGGPITGTATLNKLGAGSLILANDNTYTGPTTVAAASLELRGAFASSTVTVTGGLIFNPSSGNQTINSVITGNGTLQKLGSGTTTLGGNNPFNGTTAVDAGSLVVGNAAVLSGTVTVNNATLVANGDVRGLVDVQTGGVLHGNGSVGAIVLQNGGTLSVGNSVGSLTIDGDNAGGPSLTLNAGSVIEFEFNDVDAGPGIGWDYVELGAGLLTINAQNQAGSNDRVEVHINSLTLANAHGANDFNAAAATPSTVQEYYWKFIGLNDLSQITTTGPSSLSGRFHVIDDLVGAGVFDTADGNPYDRPMNQLGQGTFRVLAGNFGGQGNGLYIYYSAVPEPGSMLLAGLGSLAAGWYGRRKLRRKQADAAIVN